MDSLDSLLDRLCASSFRFVVVGGYAAVAHGVTLLTQDLDICCDFSWDNLSHLQKTVAPLHPVHRMTPARLPLELTQRNARGLKNLYLDCDLGQLDCMSEVVGVGHFNAVLEQSVEVQFGEYACRILSIDGLIQSKSQLNRPRDQEAVIQLRAIREGQPPPQQ